MFLMRKQQLKEEALLCCKFECCACMVCIASGFLQLFPCHQPGDRIEFNANHSLKDLQDCSCFFMWALGFLIFQRETDAVCYWAQRQSEQRVSVTHCDPSLLGGAVGSVHASTVPAACSDKSSPAVRGRAQRTRLPLCSELLCPPSVVLALSVLFIG